MAADDINLNIVVNGEEQLREVANSVRNLIAANQGLQRATKGMDGAQRALSQAFGVTSKGIGEHARSVKELRQNQRILRNESKLVENNLKSVRAELKKQKTTTGTVSEATKDFEVQLRRVKRTLDSVRPKALTNDLKSLSLAIKKAGKDAQFVGRSLIIGLTTPLIGFANRGIDALKAFDREFIRFKKIADLTEESVARFEKTFLDLSTKFGVSRDLIVGVTADFAELGIASESTLAGLTEVTNELAVLGTMDVSESQQLIQTMFLGTIRSMDLMGRTFEDAAEKQETALTSVTNQMYLFNAIENNTALSFRDMAVAIPEATAAATAFGLTMTQTAALLAPMKAAGIDVSTAANGLKVSLQRLVTPTGVLKTEMERLLEVYSDSSEVLEESFDKIIGTGMSSIQGLIDATAELRKEASDETVLQFYSKLFQKRQATRMLTAVDSLISFQEELFATSGPASEELGNFVDALNSAVEAAGAQTGGLLPDIKDVETFSMVARIGNAQVGDMIEGLGQVSQAQIDAANMARQTVREFVADTEDGFQYIDQLSSQAGKGLFVELLGAANAKELAQQELDIALNSTAIALDRAKIAFKNIAVEILSSAEPAFRKLGDVMSNIAERFANMSDSTKRVIVAIGAVVASIGPLVFIIGQMQLAFGVVAGALLKFVPNVAALTMEGLAAAPAMLRLNNAVVKSGDAYVTAAGRFQKYIATLASGNGVVAKMANRFGRLTGILSKQITAPADVMADVQADTAAGARVVGKIVEDAFHTATLEMTTGAEVAEKSIKSGGEEAKEDMIEGGVGAAKAIESGALKAKAILASAAGTATTPAKRAAMAMDAAGRAVTPGPISKKGQFLPLAAGGDAIAAQRAAQQQALIDAQRKALGGRIVQTGKGGERFISDATGKFAKMPDSIAIARSQQIAQQTVAAQRLKARPVLGPTRADLARLRPDPILGPTRADLARLTPGPTLADRRPRTQALRQNLIGSPVKTLGRGARKVDSAMGAVAAAPKKAAQAVAAMPKKVAATGPMQKLGKAAKVALHPINTISMLFGKLTKIPIIGKIVKPFGLLGKGLMMVLGPATKMIFFFTKIGKVMKVLKIGFAIFTGGLLIGAIGAIIPYIVAVAKNFDEFKEKAKAGFNALKVAFNNLKAIGSALIEPFKDLFAAIGGGASESDKVQTVANAFNTVSTFVMKASKVVKDFVNETVAPFMRKALGAVKTLIDGFKNIIKAGIDMKNGVSGAGESMKEALKQAGRGILQFFLGTLAPGLIGVFASMIKGIFNLFLTLIEKSPIIGMKLLELFVKMSPAILNVIKFMIVNAVKLFGKLVSGAGMVVNKIIHLFTEMVRVVLDKLGFFGTIIEKLGGGAILKGIEIGGNAIESLGDTLASGIDAAADGIGSLMDSMISAAEDFDTSGFAEIGENLSASIVEGLAGKREEFGAFVDGIRDDLQQSLKQFEPTPIGERLGGGIAEGAEGALEEKSDEIFVPTVESSNEAGSQAGENFANKFMDALKGIEQKFVDLVGDYFKSEIDTVTSELTDALEAQRDAALAVFDEQLSALDALEKAEKSLMKEREFLLERKRILDARELQRENYKRNRALAIYEGRIDDARMMQREDEKNQMDSASSLGQLEEKRKQDLRKENLEFMRDQIKETKKAADAFFKEQIAAFKESAKEITKFAPQTIEDYESQLNQLKDKATEFSAANAEEFAKTFTEMNDKIVNDMPNQVVGVFGDNLDEIVEEAKLKYGLGTLDQGVVGATVGLLTEMGDKFSPTGEYSRTINTNFGSIVSGLKDQITSTADDGIAATIENHGPQAVLEAAIINAETTILNEWKGTVGHILSAVDPLANMMDPMIANILEAQLAMEALEEAARSAGSAASAAGSAGSGGGGGGGGAGGGGGGGAGDRVIPQNIIAGYEQMAKAWAKDYFGNDSGGALNKPLIDAIVSFKKKIYFDASTGNVISALDTVRGAISQTPVKNAFTKFVQEKHAGAIAAYGGVYANGGRVPSFAKGGYAIPGFRSTPVAAMLHGGEYVINSKAVSNIGMAALQALNNMRFNTPGRFGGGQNVTTINKSETVNIYVENFIGEDEWFNSMVEKYDMRIRPINDRKYNTQDRFYTTYKGANY